MAWLALSAAAALAGGCTVSFSGPNGNGNNNNEVPPGCGNGILEPGEVCDGSDFGGQTCQSAVGREFGALACNAACGLDLSGCHDCGNGQIDAGETCDDASALSGDGCDQRCLVEGGWECAGTPSICGTVCGDGLVRGIERCDDGNVTGNDGCDGGCQPEPGWVCTGEPSQCAQTCGDGNLDPGETCDDGNQDPLDGCNPSCGVEAGWTCDGAEPTQCAPVCGDGLVLAGEACDDGNPTDGDGCSATCAVEPGWSCADTRPSTCAPVCGDGLVLGDEQCDDGNANNSDGCASCQVQPYFACDGAPSLCACVVYVSQDPVAGGRNGGSWAMAYDDLRQGLQVAGNRDPCEVWIAAGTYSPWQGSPGNSFDLPSRVQVYGGFVGTETRRGDRDWVAHPVILDGRNPTFPTQAVRRVVDINGGQTMVLDGLTITGANNPSGPGGGVALDGGELTVRNCALTANVAQEGGAGLWSRSGVLILEDSVVSGNSVAQDGGGIRLETSVIVVVRRTVFEDNQAGNAGGAIHANNSGLTVRQCQFLTNTATGARGGAIRVEQGIFLGEGSLFAGNEALTMGGGAVSLSQNPGGPDVIRNCTFYGNLANPGFGHALRVALGTVDVWNSIFWGVPDEQVVTSGGGTANLSRCDVARTLNQGDNLIDDPLFVDPTAGDFRLQPTSPCVDAADGNQAPAEDLEGTARWDDPAVTDTGSGTPGYADIGCFERHP